MHDATDLNFEKSIDLSLGAVNDQIEAEERRERVKLQRDHRWQSWWRLGLDRISLWVFGYLLVSVIKEFLLELLKIEKDKVETLNKAVDQPHLDSESIKAIAGTITNYLGYNTTIILALALIGLIVTPIFLYLRANKM